MKLDLHGDYERDVLRRCLLAGDEKLQRQAKGSHDQQCGVRFGVSCTCRFHDVDESIAATHRATIETLIRRLDQLHG